MVKFVYKLFENADRLVAREAREKRLGANTC